MAVNLLLRAVESKMPEEGQALRVEFEKLRDDFDRVIDLKDKNARLREELMQGEIARLNHSLDVVHGLLNARAVMERIAAKYAEDHSLDLSTTAVLWNLAKGNMDADFDAYLVTVANHTSKSVDDLRQAGGKAFGELSTRIHHAESAGSRREIPADPLNPVLAIYLAAFFKYYRRDFSLYYDAPYQRVHVPSPQKYGDAALTNMSSSTTSASTTSQSPNSKRQRLAEAGGHSASASGDFMGALHDAAASDANSASAGGRDSKQ